MKRILLLFAFCLSCWGVASAQLPNGSIAPDFTATDLDGVSHNLYDLLNAGKTVYIDFSATWCGPCWNYHNSHAFKNLWEQRGPGGTNEVYCFFIEGDAATNTACLYGPSGCIGGTQGDWVTGTPYPIIESAAIDNQYAVSYYPTIYCICPDDKKVYVAGQLGAEALWNFRNVKCAPPPMNYNVNLVRNVKCINTNTGAIDIAPGGGTGTYTYLWSSGQTTQDLNNVPAGTYTVSITSGGVTLVSDPIDVEAPALPLTAEVVDMTLVGCNGVLASITISGLGGWDSEYTYKWQHGGNTETATGLSPGQYKATVTDAGGCTTTIVQTVAPAVYPVAVIAPPGTITCTQTNIQLNATGSDSGPDFTYQWFASNGGNIVSGATTLTPVVNAAGNYTFQITNAVSTCTVFLGTAVAENLTQPSADAGAPGIVSCPFPVDTLAGSGSTGSNYTYSWTGGVVVEGGNTLSPVVGAAATYTLMVTNTTNGCTKTSTTSVTGFNTPPSLSTTSGALTCVADTFILSTTTNSNNPTFLWSGPNGYTSTLQSPVVDTSGTYNVVVNDTITGCSNTATATVVVSIEGPGATATADALSCLVSMAVVQGITLDTNATYAWIGPLGFTSDTSTFSVGVPGQYNLVVTDPDNGCTSATVAMVADNTIPPVAAAVAPGNLNCNTAQMVLNGSGSAQGIDISYSWTTADGNIVEGGNTHSPLVNAVGSYTLLVSNSSTGCTNTAMATVAQSPPVTAEISAQNNALCFGSSSGSATAAGLGGNGIFSYAWSNGGTLATNPNLSAGVYLVTLTDGENCTAAASVTIAQPDILLANITVGHQSLSGVNDGSVSTNPSGGMAGYTYLWSNGATTQNISNLPPGNYSVSITDANGCVVVRTVTVNAFDCALSVSISGQNASCFDDANGSATVSHTGGAEPLTFQWSNGGTSQTVTGLGAGTYTVNITDANNCPASLDIEILEPTQLFGNASATHETFAGGNNGTASANPTGGTAPYSYLWSNGATTPSISNLAPGAYTVEVTDQNGCAVVRTVVVNAFSCAVSATNTVSHVNCPGGNSGAIVLALVGGTAPFTYSWSNGANTSSISNLAGGTYTATIVDANQCQIVSEAVVNEPMPFTDWNVQVNNATCPNDGTGAAEASIGGGTAPYTFLWSNGATGSNLSNVNAGVYTVVATDAHGCTNATAVIIGSNDQEIPMVSAQNATIALDNLGNATVTVAAISAQFSDNCGIASAVIVPNTFSCAQLGEHDVLLTVTDLSGLSNVVTVRVTIVDTELPVVTCPENIVVCPSDNQVNYQPATAQDNCLILSGQWAQTSGLPSGAMFPVGTTEQTFTFTDASGNLGSCSFSVTVTPPVTFDNVAITNDHNGMGVGAVNITFSGGVGPFSFSWTMGGAVIATTEDVGGLVQGNYNVVVTDAQGCTYLLEGVPVGNTVAVQEPSWLSGVSLQPNPTSEMTQVVFASPLTTRLEIAVIDATGRVLKTLLSEQAKQVTINCAELPSGMYTLRFRSNQEIGTRKLMVIK
jgi:HYR domain/Secretion system C-terminal sorting domain/SprB repeat